MQIEPISDIKSSLDLFLTERLDHYIQETAELCAQPSISARQEGTIECAALVAKILRRHGLEVQSFPTAGNPIVVGRMKGKSDRTLLFYNHYDVQPPEPLDQWITPPFEPTVRDGALYARGARDDKGELIARLAALDAVREAHGGELPCSVVFVVEGEEEIASPHVAEFVKANLDLLRCDGAIWEEGGVDPEGHPMNVLGCRGNLGVELAVTAMKMDAHSGAAHVLPSAAWRLVRALTILKDENERVLIPGFYDHAKPPTAAELALCDAVPSFEEEGLALFGIKAFLLNRKGVELNRSVYEPTCNIQGITTGYQGDGMKTIIPAHASAKIDFRLVPDQDPDDIFDKLVAYLKVQGFGDVQVTRGGSMWPYTTTPDNGLVELTLKTGAEVYGKSAQLLPLNGGSTPYYAFARPLGGIPIVAPGVGYWDNHAHAPNEHVRLEDFLNGARQIARILDGFAELK